MVCTSAPCVTTILRPAVFLVCVRAISERVVGLPRRVTTLAGVGRLCGSGLGETILFYIAHTSACSRAYEICRKASSRVRTFARVKALAKAFSAHCLYRDILGLPLYSPGPQQAWFCIGTQRLALFTHARLSSGQHFALLIPSEKAEQARDALIAHGFPEETIQIGRRLSRFCPLS